MFCGNYSFWRYFLGLQAVFNGPSAPAFEGLKVKFLA
jgi:hypothetical protein